MSKHHHVFDINNAVDDPKYGLAELAIIFKLYATERAVGLITFPALVNQDKCEVEWPILRSN